ncbi:MarR family winged helix-turn-helix transcriptional regulator [Paraburkholderia sp.]|uniref:MarR family winged helix-turn-helix transcriptional regulator n=1 Tax=Paraburkholderia sp. TaxID=1926495 RepID=UPI0039E24C80
MRAGTPSAVEKGNAKDRSNDPARDAGNETPNGNGAAADRERAYFLTFKLDLIKSEMISRANAAYRPAFGLDVRSLRVLRIICDAAGITATALKEQTLIEKTLLSKLVADLIERKLVRRSIHPDDARHFQLWATAAGKRVRVASDELGQSLETEMLSMLSADERGQLNRIVDKLVDVFRKAGRGGAER